VPPGKKTGGVVRGRGKTGGTLTPLWNRGGGVPPGVYKTPGGCINTHNGGDNKYTRGAPRGGKIYGGGETTGGGVTPPPPVVTTG